MVPKRITIMSIAKTVRIMSSTLVYHVTIYIYCKQSKRYKSLNRWIVPWYHGVFLWRKSKSISPFWVSFADSSQRKTFCTHHLLCVHEEVLPIFLMAVLTWLWALLLLLHSPPFCGLVDCIVIILLYISIEQVLYVLSKRF